MKCAHTALNPFHAFIDKAWKRFARSLTVSEKAITRMHPCAIFANRGILLVLYIKKNKFLKDAVHILRCICEKNNKRFPNTYVHEYLSESLGDAFALEWFFWNPTSVIPTTVERYPKTIDMIMRADPERASHMLSAAGTRANIRRFLSIP